MVCKNSTLSQLFFTNQYRYQFSSNKKFCSYSSFYILSVWVKLKAHIPSCSWLQHYNSQASFIMVFGSIQFDIWFQFFFLTRYIVSIFRQDPQISRAVLWPCCCCSALLYLSDQLLHGAGGELPHRLPRWSLARWQWQPLHVMGEEDRLL